MNIYISGPIEGVDNYREKFERAKRIIEKGGHKAINPAGLDLYGLTREQSCGANREYGYALAKGLDIMFERDE